MESTNRLPVANLAMATLSGIFLTIGFATPYWGSSILGHGGLWEACQPNCVRLPFFVNGFTGTVYLDQIIFTAGFLLTAVSFIMLLVFVVSKRRSQRALLVVSIIFGIIAVLVNLGGLLLLGIGFGISYGTSSLSLLGWSYALVCVSACLHFISIILSIVISCTNSRFEANPGAIVMSPYQPKY